MENDISAKSKWLAAKWGGESIVNDEHGALVVSNGSALFDIDDIVGWILNGLCVQHFDLRVLVHSSSDSLNVSKVNKLYDNTETSQLVSK